ncbi:MAG: hypothetical protein Kapaf2KO_00780 [Candidatus Kapaibacteriales bacterium]
MRTGTPKPVNSAPEMVSEEVEDEELGDIEIQESSKTTLGTNGLGTGNEKDSDLLENDLAENRTSMSGYDTIVKVKKPLILGRSFASNETGDRLIQISNMLDNGRINSARILTDKLMESLPIESEDYYSSMYYLGESYVAENNTDEAIDIFLEILESESKGEAREKSLIRTGQIMCIDGDTAGAEVYFSLLQKEYPESIYLPLAQCY